MARPSAEDDGVSDPCRCNENQANILRHRLVQAAVADMSDITYLSRRELSMFTRACVDSSGLSMLALLLSQTSPTSTPTRTEPGSRIMSQPGARSFARWDCADCLFRGPADTMLVGSGLRLFGFCFVGP